MTLLNNRILNAELKRVLIALVFIPDRLAEELGKVHKSWRVKLLDKLLLYSDKYKALAEGIWWVEDTRGKLVEENRWGKLVVEHK